MLIIFSKIHFFSWSMKALMLWKVEELSTFQSFVFLWLAQNIFFKQWFTNSLLSRLTLTLPSWVEWHFTAHRLHFILLVNNFWNRIFIIFDHLFADWIRALAFFNITIKRIIDSDDESKVGALAYIRFHSDLTLELSDDHLWYGETESHSSFVDLSRVVKSAEELKELLLILLLNAHTCVNDWGRQLLLLIANIDSDPSFEGKLHCIANKIEKDLLKSFLVWLDHCRYWRVKLQIQKEWFLCYLKTHYWRNFFYGISHIEKLWDYLKLVVFYSRHVQGVFNNILKM